jgi:hypothetical protein
MDINLIKEELKELEELNMLKNKVNRYKNLDYIAGVELYIENENVFQLFKTFINEEYEKKKKKII